MESLLFPIIMLAVTLAGGGILLLLLKTARKCPQTDPGSAAMQTAQQFINVKDIRDKYLYTRDGMAFVYLRIHAVSIDLYSRAEKSALIKTLTAELSDVQYPFKFMALSRPVDISPLIAEMGEMLKEAEDKRKELLRQEILQMGGFALSGEIVERQFYIALWEKQEEGTERELSKRAFLLCEKFAAGGVACDILVEKEIVRLLNLVNNPSYTHLEDMETAASIPMNRGGVWRCWWHASWVWVPDWKWERGNHGASCPDDCTSSHGRWVDKGEWKDKGWYDYAWDSYSAALSAAMRIIPDEKNPTAAGTVLKSGYGINMTASAQVVSGAPSGHITEPQTAVAYFPEFQYTDYWRLLERTSPGYSAAFQFRVNEYSTYGRRTHFTPVWFPDGNYTVYAQVMDAWTPAGMLQIHLGDTLTVHGNLFSDWHVRPIN